MRMMCVAICVYCGRVIDDHIADDVAVVFVGVDVVDSIGGVVQVGDVVVHKIVVLVLEIVGVDMLVVEIEKVAESVVVDADAAVVHNIVVARNNVMVVGSIDVVGDTVVVGRMHSNTVVGVVGSIEIVAGVAFVGDHKIVVFVVGRTQDQGYEEQGAVVASCCSSDQQFFE